MQLHQTPSQLLGTQSFQNFHLTWEVGKCAFVKFCQAEMPCSCHILSIFGLMTYSLSELSLSAFGRGLCTSKLGEQCRAMCSQACHPALPGSAFGLTIATDGYTLDGNAGHVYANSISPRAWSRTFQRHKRQKKYHNSLSFLTRPSWSVFQSIVCWIDRKAGSWGSETDRHVNSCWKLTSHPNTSTFANFYSYHKLC